MKNYDRKIEEMWNDIDAQCLKLRILMGGKAGVGKSSVINAIIGETVSDVASDGKPCTRVNEEIVWHTDNGDISITDVPGFGEANSSRLNGLTYKENITKLAQEAHLLLMILKCDDKALELEEKFMDEWKKDPALNRVPVFIVINQIDKMKPTRIWNPQELNLKNPSTQKELNICSYINYISEIPIFNTYHYTNSIIPVSAGEHVNDETFGIEILRQRISSSIPEIMSIIINRDQMSKDRQASSVINYYAAAAGAAAVQPIPIVDSFLIAPIQIAMLIHLGKIYGVKITRSVAGGLVSSLGLSFLGNFLFLNIVSFIPGVSQVAGPAIAYSLTFTYGLIVKELFLTGNLNPTREELEELARKFKSESKAARDRYEQQQKK
jgi:Uncharacterized protein/domain associated with GTPases